MKQFFLTILLAIMASALIFAQQTPTPAPLPTPCNMNGDHLYVYDSDGQAGVREVYFTEGFQPCVIELFKAPGVDRIIVTPNGDAWAFSDSGKIYHRVRNYDGSYSVQVSKSIAGGYVELYEPEFGSFLYRFPFDRETYAVYPYYNGGGAGTNLIPSMYSDDDVRNRCSTFVRTTVGASAGYELCLDPMSWVIWQPFSTLGGPDYKSAQPKLSGQQPVNMVNGGDVIYVTLGTKYLYSELPTVNGFTPPSGVVPGKLIAVHPQQSDIATEVLVDNLDIDPNMYADRLAASAKGVYYVTKVRREKEFIYTLNFYNRTTKNITVVHTTKGMLSGLTVAPQMPTIAMGGGGGGISTPRQ